MSSGIAIVGLACVYPDARSPQELWENALAQRQAFRRLPPNRLREEDYFDADPAAPDRTYCFEAAVIEGYEFDRGAFHIAGSTYRSADLAHWLALDVAARALADAGFPGGQGLPRSATGVLIGNSLAGEFSRASQMRLRWPYVERTLESALHREGWPAPERRRFLQALETEYRRPFPPVEEETLAGGLSNTIAGRICNFFDLKGGGYTVDGACASSLLAVANACSALAAGDLDVALAGGVDLSLDPFELVGFAKTRALAPERMRVYDARSAGFWPGEGCGVAVLMRLADARAAGRKIDAVIRGWGISSDGSGGITRPELSGQLEALRRAYRRAGFGAEAVGYFEGHGTGTEVGDATELKALTQTRLEAGRASSPAALGSIKANIGHTKAAAGIAGLLKATLALRHRVLPPTTGCEEPHPEITQPQPPLLRILRQPEPWRDERPRRAAVSAMGFGGINAHVVLEEAPAANPSDVDPLSPALASAPPDAELFLFCAERPDELRRDLRRVGEFAAQLSYAELADLAAELARRADHSPRGGCRAAIVAASPEELAGELERLEAELSDSGALADENSFAGAGARPPRLGFLFPGQGSSIHLDGGIFPRRFVFLRDLFSTDVPAPAADPVGTEVAQPAIATASLAGLRVLNRWGIDAAVAVGHSLGELSALHWAGALGERDLLRIATARGSAMGELGSPSGAMVAIGADAPTVRALLNGDPVELVGLNSPRQTVVAGDVKAVNRLADRAQARGLRAVRLSVSHAFHTKWVEAAVPRLRATLQPCEFQPASKLVISTVLGRPLQPTDDLRELLCDQVTAPVQFLQALGQAGSVDLWIEVGPGQTLSSLARECGCPAALSIDGGGPSLRPLLQAVGAAFARGATLSSPALFADRFVRPFSLDWRPKFFSNPCELAPLSSQEGGLSGSAPEATRRRRDDEALTALAPSRASPTGNRDGASSRQLLRRRRDDETLTSLAPPRASPAGKRDGASSRQLLRRRRGDEALTSPAPSREPMPESEMEPPHVGSYAPAAEISSLDLIRSLVAQRAELPESAIRPGLRLLGDLHLNSISVGQLVSEAVRRMGLPPLHGLTDFATATVQQIADALEALRRDGASAAKTEPDSAPPGIESWVRPFVVQWIPAPLRRSPDSASGQAKGQGQWKLIASRADSWSNDLLRKLTEGPDSGVLLVLAGAGEQAQIPLLLDAAREALARPAGAKLALIQSAWRSGSFVRSLHLEFPQITTCVIEISPERPPPLDQLADEITAAQGHVDVRYAPTGDRSEPRLVLLELPVPNRETPIDPGDVVLITGGGKGIAAECAWQWARRSGARFILWGRSSPDADPELAANLKRFDELGARYLYQTVDVANANVVRAAMTQAQTALGEITVVAHAAGVNQPQSIATLDEAAFQRTLAPKVDGLRHVLAALEPDQLRLLVTFGSIIGRSGLRGQADYAVANEWQTQLTEQFQARHPNCRCLAVEWSVWSNLGMGARLGRVEALRQQGVCPIPPEVGVETLDRLLRAPSRSASVIVSGRLGNLSTLAFASRPLPPRRFLERIRVDYPGLELVAEAELSPESDPYLGDHVYHGELLFPAVMGLEAMAQTAMALMESSEPPQFSEIELSRPVVVPRAGSLTVRLAALVKEPGVVQVALRSAETGFQADHFRATCRFPATEAMEWRNGRAGPSVADAALKEAPLMPAADLYGPLLFHTGRFQRVRRYRKLRAQECVAEIEGNPVVVWFGANQPPDCVLADAGVRDAAIHAIQACLPHARLLPVGIRRILLRPRSEPIVPSPAASEERLVLHARETSNNGAEYCYDLELTDPRGAWRERWEGLRLRKVEEIPPPAAWPAALLSVAWERRVQELLRLPDLALLLARELARDQAARELGVNGPILNRADGKPETSAQRKISLAHAGDLTLAVAWTGRVGCDLEPVRSRSPDEWRALLGADRFDLARLIADQEDFALAATRVWTALEAIKKAGLAVESPMTLERRHTDGAVLLRCGEGQIVTLVDRLRGLAEPAAMAVLAHPELGATSSAANLAAATVRPLHPPKRAYEYPLTVSFEDTNVVGNVYFANYIRWQGKVREQFLCDHAPQVLDELRAGLELLTLAVEGRFHRPLFALDRVTIRMRLDQLTLESARMRFEYVRKTGQGEELVAEGSQEIAACRVEGGRRRATPLPNALIAALRDYA